MNAGVVDQEVQRQAVERPPGRPAPVHGPETRSPMLGLQGVKTLADYLCNYFPGTP